MLRCKTGDWPVAGGARIAYERRAVEGEGPMGLRDLFRRGRQPPAAPAAVPPPTAERRFHRDRARMFDLAATGRLVALFAVPRDRRDAGWVTAFWDAAWRGSVALAEPKVFTGPDGFPYLRLDLPRPDAPFDSQCLANLAGDCLRSRVGAAFFASPDADPGQAEFVLTYGTIDSLLRYDSPDGDPVDLAEAEGPADGEAFAVERGAWSRTLTTRAPHEVLIGSPSADYLPPETAAALCGYFEHVWGLADPRVSLMVDMKLRPHRALVIGRKRSEFPPGANVDHLARTPLWYLPPSRSVMLMPEDGSLAGMTPLRSLFAAAGPV
jgi:hypothetical protein